MSELQEFLDTVVAQQRVAERAIHDGDTSLRLAMWTEHDPATLLGAAMPCVSGAVDVRNAFSRVGSWFSDCTSYELEVVAGGVSGDLAYTVGFEHTTAKVQGVPRTYTLRATHVYRREDGEWRIVHRHADPPPTNEIDEELGDEELGNETADLDGFIERHREALRQFARGDAEPVIANCSTRDDVTLANPLGPAVRGAAAVAAVARDAAKNFAEGGSLPFVEVDTTFEEVSRFETPGLAYLVQVERIEGRVEGREGVVSIPLRTTMVFRREANRWRLAHRHADPIDASRGIETTIS